VMNTLTRRDFMKVVGVGTLGASAALALASCGTKTDAGTATGGAATGGTTGGTTTGGTTGGGTTSGGTAGGDGPVSIVWGSYDNQGGHDNFSGATTAVYPRILQLYQDTLFASNHDGTYDPWIATDWKWSDDFLHLNVKIRDDVYFHSGDKLVADDVKFSFERVVFNLEENSSTYLKGEIESIEVVSDTELNFNFVLPTSCFMLYAANHFGIINQSAWESSEDFWDNPDGSGPYIMTDSNVSTSVFTFQRWDEWWGWDDKHSTNVDTITYRGITDVTSRVASIRAGECDVIDDVPLDQLDLLAGEGISVGSYDRCRPYAFLLQCGNDRPFSDVNLRKAFSLSLDRQTICDSILGGGRPSTCLATPEMIGHIDGSKLDYDPAAAKALVDASNYNGEEIIYLTSDVICANATELAQAVQAWANEVGLNLKIDMLDNASFQARARAGDYDIRVTGSPCNDGDPNGFVKVLGAMDAQKMHYDNEEFDNILDEAYHCVDTAERDELYQQAFQIVNDDLPCLPMWWPTEGWAIKPNVEGMIIYPDAMFDMRWIKVN